MILDTIFKLLTNHYQRTLVVRYSKVPYNGYLTDHLQPSVASHFSKSPNLSSYKHRADHLTKHIKISHLI